MRPVSTTATILGIDTATASAAVAVTRGGDLVAERVAMPPAGGRPRHAELLLTEVEAVIERAGGWQSVELLAVGAGPGTFTGLRIGIATARALAQARGLRIAAVSSLAALARGADDRGAGLPRLAAIDARRGEIFVALYGTDGATLWEPWVAGPEAVAERLAREFPATLALGDGSLRFREQLEAAGAEVPPATDPGHRIAARHVCALALESEPVAPAEVKPIYLRRPDAEVWREQRELDEHPRSGD